MVTHLRSLGHSVHRLEGGYRSFREHVRWRLDQARIPNPVVINGLTGSGKTLVVRELARRFPDQVVDLEALAGHRSSVLGGVGLEPVSQKRFESGLVAALAKLRGPWSLFEWEARRIGDRQLPTTVFEQLRSAIFIRLEATVEQRVQVLVDEYVGSEPVRAACATREIVEKLQSLARFEAIGEAGVKRLQEQLQAGDFDSVVRELLERHYDPRYLHGSQQHKYAAEFTLQTAKDGDSNHSAALTADRVCQWLEARYG